MIECTGYEKKQLLVYCNNIYDSMNRFEAHMKMHVRKILFNYYLINIFFYI